MKQELIPEEFFSSGALMTLFDGSILIGYGAQTWCSFVDLDPERPAFYFPDFFLDSPKPWCQFRFDCILNAEDLLTLLVETATCSEIKWGTPDKAIYSQSFFNLKKEISAGLLKKAVPYLFFESDTRMTSSRLNKVLKSALKHMISFGGYAFGFWNEQEGMLGVTPELLFTLSGKKLRTMALAGTKKNLESKDLLMNDPKERHEHQLVVEGIAKALKTMGEVSFGELQVLELPSMSHLMTPIEVDLDQEASFERFVSQLHPTPALGAVPSPRGEEWLREYHATCPRGRFGAPAGIICKNRGIQHCLVAIRNMQWNETGMKIGAGGGVVDASELESEWNEVQLKSRAIQKILSVSA